MLASVFSSVLIRSVNSNKNNGHKWPLRLHVYFKTLFDKINYFKRAQLSEAELLHECQEVVTLYSELTQKNIRGKKDRKPCVTSLTIILFETIHLPLNGSFYKRPKHSYAKWRWQQNTQVIALLHAKTPLSCCVSSQLKTGTVLSTERIRLYIMGEKQTDHFLVQKLPFSERDECKAFLMKMSYICVRIKNYFHINGFAPSPTLKQGREATRKWPIGFHVFLSWLFDYPHTNSPNWSPYISLKNESREFDKRSKYFLVSDHFIYSHHLFAWLSFDIVRRKLMLVTMGLKWLTEAICTPWVSILCFFDPDVVLVLHPFSYEVNTCVDPPHEQKIVALQFQPQKRKDPDMTLLAVTAGADGKFKIWVLGEERLGRSKNKQKNYNHGFGGKQV